MDIRVAGENALIVYLAREASPGTLSKIRQLTGALEAACPLEIVDLNPGYHSLVVVYDNRRTSFARLRNTIRSLKPAAGDSLRAGNRIRLPVYYAPESGPDLKRIARDHGLDIEEVIRTHSGRPYLVYAMGFAPGFAYLGEVDPRIATPRHKTPRLKVPPGAVAIADAQTAVYPSESPGGWNLVGRCPVTLFDPANSQPSRCAVGDEVTFYPIDREQYLAMGGTL